MDIISAGEVHSIAANSKTGMFYFWGKIKGQESPLLKTEEILRSQFYVFKKNGIQDIKSSMNHALILSGGRVYCFGDKSTGALGNVFHNDSVSWVDINDFTALPHKNVVQIYTTYYSSVIIVQKRTKKDGIQKWLFAFGLNNYGQLGVKTESNFQMTPIEWEDFDADQIQEISGGEHHTLFLMKNGEIFGAGRNDDGQLGEVEDVFGTCKKLTHISNVERIYSASHFNYCKEKNSNQFYAWGFGSDYVLGNGLEISLYKARPVN